MIEVINLTKHYGSHTAVDGLSFTVRPGVVTGFVGPNGAGRSTTMRMILGLDRPTAGRSLVNGRPFEKHRAPLREIGALLDAKGTHPARSARDHLSALAATTGISKRRVAEVLDLVGLSEVADRRSGGFSLGMGQRLGIASALLGDPRTVMLDGSANLQLQELTPARASLEDIFIDLTKEGVDYHGATDSTNSTPKLENPR